MRRMGGGGRFSVLPVVLALLAGLLVAIAPAVTHPQKAAATIYPPHPVGTAGLFVPATGVLLDTTHGTGGYSTPMPASSARLVQVDGAAGLPTSGISAIAVSLSVVNYTGSGFVSGAASDGTLGQLMLYGYGVTSYATSSAIIPVGANGKIQVYAQTSVDLVIDLQGYYTVGNGTTAAGGFVPMNQQRLIDTRAGTGTPVATLKGGTTYTFTAAGHAGIPAGAQAIFVDFTVRNFWTGPAALDAYSTDDATMPPGYMYFPATDQSTALTATVPIGADGKFHIHLDGTSALTIDLFADVEGYWIAGSSAGSFTPAFGRVLDTRSDAPLHVAANATRKVQIEGVGGIPPVGSGISAVVYSLSVIDSSTGGGYTVAWPDGKTMPSPADDLNYRQANRSSLQTTMLGTDGAIDIKNVSADQVDYLIDIEGWYTNAGGAIANGQTQTTHFVGLKGTDTGGGGYVTYNYRLGTTGSFQQVPPGDTTDLSTGSAPSAWPAKESSTGVFDTYDWNVQNTLGNQSLLLEVEACYGTTATTSTAAQTCSAPQNLQYAPQDFGSDTSSFGPGTLSLLTGDFELSATDAAVSTSLDGLSVGRTLTTLYPSAATSGAPGVFGPGWTSDLTGPSSGDATLTPKDESSTGYILFTGTDGTTTSYEAIGSTSTYPVAYTPVGADAGNGIRVAKTDANTITMTDADGTVTTWANSSGVWQVTKVAAPGSSTAASYSYTSGLVTRIIAPVPAGVSCATAAADTTIGCRSLVLNYETLLVNSSPVTRLASIALSAPQTAGTVNEVAVAQYDYDANGRLADAYDPRLSSPLKTAYTYNTDGRLATVTPPGQAAWALGYNSAGQLVTVSRTAAAQTATGTAVYGVPVSGSSAPVALDASTASSWGETNDLPHTGTAIFPPSHTPAATDAASVTSADWPYADIHYMDVNGLEVNTADYGAGKWLVDTTQYDANGNDVWDLTAGNRAQALTPTAATDPFVAAQTNSADRANLLASVNYFDSQDPSEETDSYGPAHPVTLSNVAVIDGQDHTATTYADASAPDGETGLPATVTVTEYNDATDLDTAWPNARITSYGYAAVGSMSAAGVTGWSLHEATTTTVQMSASPSSTDLVTTDAYDAQGRTIAHSLPADKAGTGAQTQLTSYYTATGTGPCVSPVWAGLTCQTGPAAQPTTGNPLPVTTYSYDQYGDLLTKTETAGATTRTTTSSYDAAGRITGQQESISPVTGQALAPVTYSYDPATGLPASASTGAAPAGQTVSMGYDSLGRQTSYTDANAQTTTTAYDLDGDPVTVTTPVGTTSYSYDSSSEHRGLVTSEDIGAAGQPSTFQASYDADGNLAVETYPNGLTATTGRDGAGNATSLVYMLGSSTWMSFTNTIGLGGNTVAQTSPGHSQSYAFDGDGRLTTSQDTASSAGSSPVCTATQYGFDADSNRTSLATSTPTAGGCGTAGASTASTFDAADRITNAGYSYDALGRTTQVPGADAPASAAFSGATGNLTLGYYANDMAATETQGSWSMAYTLDPVQDRIASATATNGATSTSTVNDYADNSDNPAWSTTGGAWTRDVAGPDGLLDATVSQAGTVSLQLTDLNGSIIATAADDPTDTGIDQDQAAAYTPYGVPVNTEASTAGYGWEGANQRSSDSLGGLTLMGARLYNPTTGRFLTTDSVYGGNANPYIYPADPINNHDSDGKMSSSARRYWRWAASVLGWLQLIADGLAFFAAVFVWALEPILGLIAVVISALSVTATCIAYRWGSAACIHGLAFAIVGLIGPIWGVSARAARAGRAGKTLAERIGKLSSEWGFLLDVYDHLRSAARGEWF